MSDGGRKSAARAGEALNRPIRAARDVAERDCVGNESFCCGGSALVSCQYIKDFDWWECIVVGEKWRVCGGAMMGTTDFYLLCQCNCYHATNGSLRHEWS